MDFSQGCLLGQRRPARGEAGAQSFQRAHELEHLEKHRDGNAGDHRSLAGAHFEEPGRGEGLQRLAHRRARHLEAGGQVCLVDTVSRLELSADYHFLDRPAKLLRLGLGRLSAPTARRPGGWGCELAPGCTRHRLVLEASVHDHHTSRLSTATSTALRRRLPAVATATPAQTCRAST